jgi:hypothetical protein
MLRRLLNIEWKMLPFAYFVILLTESKKKKKDRAKREFSRKGILRKRSEIPENVCDQETMFLFFYFTITLTIVETVRDYRNTPLGKRKLRK